MGDAFAFLFICAAVLGVLWLYYFVAERVGDAVRVWRIRWTRRFVPTKSYEQGFDPEDEWPMR